MSRLVLIDTATGTRIRHRIRSMKQALKQQEWYETMLGRRVRIQYFAKMFEPVLRRANHRFPFALFAPSREISARGVEPHAKPRSREIQFPGAENSR